MSGVSVTQEERGEDVAILARPWSPWAIVNSALFATLVGGVLYFLGFSRLMGDLATLGVPPEAVPLDWTSHVHNGFTLAFRAADAYFLVVLLSLGLSMGIGWIFRLRLRRRVASGKPLTNSEQENARFWTHLLDPGKIMARAPRWIVPMMTAGMAGTYAQAVLEVTPSGALSRFEATAYETLAALSWVVAAAFLVVAALDRPPWSRSFYETVRRGGPLLHVLVSVLGLFLVANYAYTMGSLDAEASLLAGPEAFPSATLHMKDPISTLHGMSVIVLFHADAAYYVKDMGDPRGTDGPVIMVPTADVAFIVYE